jgi:hypothetical protein
VTLSSVVLFRGRWCRLPLTQTNLGNAQLRLGERESGTGKLTEAVAAYRAALEEITPQTDPTNYQQPQSSSHFAKKEKREERCRALITKSAQRFCG